MLFWSVFLKPHKKVINRQKRPKWCFWRPITFFVHFKNTNQKNICASIVFKAESKPKHEEEKNVGGFFFKNQKCTFSGVQISSFKTQISIFFLRLFFNVKGNVMLWRR